MSELSARILEFPVRAAAVEDFRRQLASKGMGDLSALAAALSDRALFTELFAYWVEREWAIRAPSSPVYAYAGAAFSPAITLREFCGESIGYDAPTSAETSGPGGEPGGPGR